MDNEQLLKHLPNKDVVFAGLHGSRAYGLHNKNSDYDLKFVWKLPVNDYLNVLGVTDTGYSKVTDKVDTTGWELRHFLNLVRKNNMTALEVLQCEDLTKNHLFQELQNEVLVRFNRRSLGIQYLRTAKSYLNKAYETETPVAKQKYFVRGVRSYMCALDCKALILPRLHQPINLLKPISYYITMVENINYSEFDDGSQIRLDVLNNTFRKIVFS